MSRPTDHANTDLPKLHADVCKRRAGGRVIWQPRILCWYYDKLFAHQPLPAPYTGMTLPQLYRALGVSNRIYEYNSCFQHREHPGVQFSRRELSPTEYEVTVTTPVGKQTAVFRTSANSPWHMPVKWWIDCEQDLKVARWRTLNCTWTWRQDEYDKLNAEWRGLGAPTMYMPRVNVQHLYVDVMGYEEAVFALADYPAAVEGYFEAVADSDRRLIEVINASPIDIINFGDNIHASTCSPALFAKYVLPAYQERNRLLHAAGKFTCAHWDGDTGPLLPFARETGLDGIEAITPRPQGDVELPAVKKALGDMFLLDGIPAIYFDKTFSERTLVDCARECIELFAPNLVLGISDEMSSTGDIERVRLVTEVVDDYNAGL